MLDWPELEERKLELNLEGKEPPTIIHWLLKIQSEFCSVENSSHTLINTCNKLLRFSTRHRYYMRKKTEYTVNYCF